MAKIVGLPKLSPTMDEGTLVRWAKKKGDAIAIDDLIAEVETDKATMEFRSFDRGVLLAQLVPEGTTLAPDQPVLILGEAGEDITALLAQVGAKPVDSTPVVVPSAPVTASPAPASPAAASPAPDVSQAPAAAAVRAPGERVLASPLVRRLAREHDVDLSRLVGTGPHGRIVKRDFDAALASAKTPVVASSPRGGRVEKLTPMRKTIARRLSESKREVPHFYLTIDVDAEPLLRAREELNAALENEKVSVNDLLIKACALALRKVPECNASFTGDSLTFHDRVDISVAVAVPDGLVTPVVRDADEKGVLEISREVKELAGRAKTKKLKPEEMTDGTFSISNLGMFGIESFSAVINPPEGAILAVGTVRDEPVVRGGAVVPGKRLRLTMSCDHRVIDGALGARWLQALRELVEKPIRMVL